MAMKRGSTDNFSTQQKWYKKIERKKGGLFGDVIVKRPGFLTLKVLLSSLKIEQKLQLLCTSISVSCNKSCIMLLFGVLKFLGKICNYYLARVNIVLLFSLQGLQ